jgi:tripartite-type tricarboxylate transporter receptor subunit TctC
MKPTQRRRLVKLAAGAIATSLMPSWVSGQSTYPNRPIKLVIPFAPGGPTDIFARLFGVRLSELLGQPVVPENRSGAGSNIGMDWVAKAAPDGYTLAFGTGSIPTAAALTKIPYDPRKDIEPIALLGIVPLVMLGAPNMPSTAVGLIEHIKKTPGKYSFGSAGIGTTTHLAGEMLKLKAGLDIVHVPYRGSGPALQETVAGRQAFLFETITASKGLYSSGKLQLLAVGTKTRVAMLPDVPTLSEIGVSGMAGYTWNMLFAPAQTARTIIDRLNKASNQILSEPAFVKHMADLATEAVSNSTPESARAFLFEELDTWANVVKQANVKGE